MWCPAHSRNDLHIHFLPSLQLCCLCLGQSAILPCGVHITVPVAATDLSSKADWPLPLLLRSTCTPHTCPAHAASSRRGPCQALAWHVPRGAPGAPGRAGAAGTAEGTCLQMMHRLLSPSWQVSEQIERGGAPSAAAARLEQAQERSSGLRALYACAFS